MSSSGLPGFAAPVTSPLCLFSHNSGCRKEKERLAAAVGGGGRMLGPLDTQGRRGIGRERKGADPARPPAVSRAKPRLAGCDGRRPWIRFETPHTLRGRHAAVLERLDGDVHCERLTGGWSSVCSCIAPGTRSWPPWPAFCSRQPAELASADNLAPLLYGESDLESPKLP